MVSVKGQKEKDEEGDSIVNLGGPSLLWLPGGSNTGKPRSIW